MTTDWIATHEWSQVGTSGAAVKFVVCTASNAPKVRALQTNAKVALTVDAETQPPHLLLIRGTAFVGSSTAYQLSISRHLRNTFRRSNGRCS